MNKADELFYEGKYAEASTLYEEQIDIDSDFKPNYWHLGLCLLFQGQPEDAQMTWWMTFDENESNINEFVEFIRNISREFALKAQRQDMAIAILEAAVELDLENEVVLLLTELARFYSLSFRHHECIEIGKKYLALAPDLPNQIFATYFISYSLLQEGSQWQEIFAWADRQTELVRALIQQSPNNLSSNEVCRLFFATSFLSYINDAPNKNRILQNELFKICQNNLQRLYPELLGSSLEDKKKVNTKTKKLKIGYLSHCFRKHSVGFLSRWIFKHHDREKFDVYAYSLLNDPNYSDGVSEFIADHCDKFYKLGHDAADVVKQIKEDQIDILIDLDSITIDVSCQVMALKPAPIQVTWLGFDASGLPAIDYFIADPYVLPENAQDYYSEKIWRLPNTYIAIDSFEVLFPTIHRSQFNIPNDAIVYLSSQSGSKRHPETIKLQLKIIKSVPNSYLLIKGAPDQEGIKDLFTEIAVSEGVSSDRLIFLPMVNSEAEHRANLDIADVILDTYPYNGATTTMEALWMCIPLVTRVGEQFAARNSYTMMINAGLTEGIAWNDQEYVDWGIKFGTDESLRKQVFWKLKESRKTAPLWNAEQFTKDMESAYEQMWEIYSEDA
jgi:predicted O-linked N-acetylglucosamine transferase (SPINDLY family)